jgi:hypothetical protein
MAARIIYLDQNKWIDLARSAAGAGDDFTPAVDFVRAAKAAGAAVFPLSMAHYIESNKQHDDARYERLGRFMHELSGTVTMAGPVAIVRHEIEMAFARALPMRIEVQPFSLLGKGVGYALGMPGIRFTLRDSKGVVTEARRQTIEKETNAVLEESILTGRLPWDTVPAPRGRPDFSRYNESFVAGLYDFRRRLESDDKDLRQRAVYANVMVAMLDQLNEAREHHKIPHDVFDKMGIDGITAFLEDMPSVRVNIHLRRHWIANPMLQAKKNDHNDWFYLGAAVAYCDVVVTERHFAHIVNTGGLRKRAIVIADVRDLPRV